MTWTSIAANLSPGGSRDDVQEAAADLARRFGARLIGLAVAHPATALAGDGYAVGELLELEREALEDSLAATANAFRRRFEGSGLDVAERGTVSLAPPAACLATQARCADVIVTAPQDRGVLGQTARVNIANLIMAAGRPVLIVPPGGRRLGFGAMVVAWKDTRESRRAVADALPLLAHAERVVVLQVLGSDESVRDAESGKQVVDWLGWHGVPAKGHVARARGDELAALSDAVEGLEADVVVAGAYGRPRLSEWVLGGVTCDYLLNPDRCVLLSH
jgi:nucleotide-binding universal stress UspA family protein